MRKDLTTLMKILAGAVGIMVAASFVFSVLFIAVESDHECEGEECHICRTMEVCEGLLRQAGSAVSSNASLAAAVWLICLVSVPVVKLAAAETLVTDKVKMND